MGMGEIMSKKQAEIKILTIYLQILRRSYTGFALGFIFLSPPFSPIRFFCAIFLNLEPDFWPLKEPGFWAFFTKKSLLSITPLILVDYSIYIDTITMG